MGTRRIRDDRWANHGNVPFVAGCIPPEHGWTDAESCRCEGPLLRQVKPQSAFAEGVCGEWESCLAMTTIQVCGHRGVSARAVVKGIPFTWSGSPELFLL